MESALNQPLVLFLNSIALIIMLVCLAYTYRLRVQVQGGLIRRKMNFLFLLVLFFTLGYLVPPFLGMLPEAIRPFLVASFSIFGAIYVAISVMLLNDVVKALSE